MIQNKAPHFHCSEAYGGYFVNNIAAAINEGISFFNYRGFGGMSGWENTHINDLNNGPRMPVAVFITCLTGSFSSLDQPSRSEVFIRAGRANSFKGAVAAIGTATGNTHTCFNNCVDAGIFNGIFSDHMYYMGGALNYGKVDLYNSYPLNPDDSVDKFSYWNNLMGDPALHVWTNTPQEITAVYPAQINTNENYIEVSLTDPNGQPLQNAWVTLLKGDNEIFVSAYSDLSGNVLLPISPETDGEVKVTVTAHNYIPHQGSILLSNNESLINISETSIDDDNSGNSSGNNDTFINPGEKIELNLALKNYNSATAHEVTAEISSSDDFFTINTGTCAYGDIIAGDTSAPQSSFVLTFNDNCIGGQKATIKVDISDENNNHWTDYVSLNVQGPNLYLTELNIHDDNNLLDPGEGANISMNITNNGSTAITDVSGQISCDDSRITIHDNQGFFGTIQTGQSSDNISDTFNIEASVDICPGTQIPLTLTLTSPSGYNNTISFLLEIGEVEVTDPLGPDTFGHYIYDSGDTSYDKAPVFDWIEIDPLQGGSGVELPLVDLGEESKITVIDLPFNITFYGIPYDKLTVCSDGWVAPGVTEKTSFMNWHLPAPLGPSPMIAAFWDDLLTGDGSVCYYFDESNDRIIIEWSNIKSEHDLSTETFQIIIDAPNYSENSTGDSNILIQYKTINNTNSGIYEDLYFSHGQYATAGIENLKGNDGLEYTYNNQYPAAAQPLADNLAILISGAPYTGNTNVANIVIDAVEIDDENGVVDAGESTHLNISLQNMGTIDITNISAIIFQRNNQFCCFPGVKQIIIVILNAETLYRYNCFVNSNNEMFNKITLIR